MPELTLYGVAVSAFVAKTRIALDFKGLAYHEAPPPDGYGSAAYRAIVPSGSVPGLTVDGRPLHDSNAICEFVDEIAPEPPLFPLEPYDRARARALLGFHDTRLEAAARALFPLIKRDWRAEPDTVAAGVATINGALERLADLIDPTHFAFGAAPSLADMAYPCTIQMAELLAREMAQDLQIPAKVDDWRRAVAEIPAVERSLGIAGDAMEGWLAGFR